MLEKGNKHPYARARAIATVVAICYLALFAVLCAWGRMPVYLYYGLLGVNVLTFVLYWLDKSSARRENWRIPESWLHLVAVIGGWPAALIARYHFRHKTRKVAFRIVFWLTVLVNCAAMGWWLSPVGLVWRAS